MLSRRSALIAAAAAPLAATLPRSVQAQVAPQGVGFPQFNRFRIGGFEVTTLLAGTRTGDKPQETFGMNVSPEDFAAFSAENFIPADRTQGFFTPTLVNDGTNLILFDTGLNPEGITAALAAAGIAPDQITHVVLTHMHPDHIGGLAGAAGPTFANAAYVTGAVEHNFWSGQANEGFDAAVRPLSDRMTMLDDGGTVAPGITAMLAAGHTPGHMIYMLDSNGARMAITADTANHYVWSLARPDWEVRFDADKAAAAATRRQVFGMLAADRVPFVGYHMPFPALGFVEAAGDGFRYVPATYQFIMDPA
jgi:glyoxylase-like metal-dependent hydrolase (beta-lactamase superfamily II)